MVRPVKGHAAILEGILADPQMNHVYFDISWDEVAKYITATPESLQVSANLINKYPDRFLFGTDEVAPDSQEKYLRVYYQYYERLFNEDRPKVRAWEQANVKK